ncbi:hypothetical protein RB195_008821 [Necator americanus]|uniref:Uncharacterized protein n=1 Tax=Necator americanus TaxID=51031 RepID=A0ABR1CS92_NECAM
MDAICADFFRQIERVRQSYIEDRHDSKKMSGSVFVKSSRGSGHVVQRQNLESRIPLRLHVTSTTDRFGFYFYRGLRAAYTILTILYKEAEDFFSVSA